MKTIFTSFLVIFMLSFSFAQRADSLLVTGTVTNASGEYIYDGSIYITVSGGTTPYEYHWSDGFPDEDRDSVMAGTYEVTVYDANNDSVTASYIVEVSDSIRISGKVTNASKGYNNGAIDITVVGGTTPYTYNWSNDATTEDIDGLAVGTYELTVYDADSNFATASYTVGVLCVNFYGICLEIDATPGNNDGSIGLFVHGGTTPYTYAWNTGATTKDIDNLIPGHYTVEVKDSNDCAFELSTYIYAYERDSTEYTEPVDTLETDEPIDTCFKHSIDHVIINSYTIDGDYLEVFWLVFDADNNLMGRVVGSYRMTEVLENYYELVIRFECDRSRATSSKFSQSLYIDRSVVASVQTISNNKSIVSIYPNPVNNTATVNINAAQSVEAQMTIVSITGQVVSTQNISLNAGQNAVNINTSSLEKGTYILKLTQNQQVTVKRFVK